MVEAVAHETTAGDHACSISTTGAADPSLGDRPDVGHAGLVVAGQPVEQRVVVEPLHLVVDAALLEVEHPLGARGQVEHGDGPVHLALADVELVGDPASRRATAPDTPRRAGSW